MKAEITGDFGKSMQIDVDTISGMVSKTIENLKILFSFINIE